MSPNVSKSGGTSNLSLKFALIIVAGCAFSPLSALAQGHGGGPGGPPGGGMGQMGGVPNGIVRNFNTTTRPSAPPVETSGGLQLGPPGCWWDNKEIAHFIGLNSIQQKRMDDVFGSSRDTLLKLFKNLQREEGQLERLSHSHELDENQIFQQIDRVTTARGELEKANAHMLLQIRKEMTSQQISKMDDLMPPPPGSQE